MFGDTFSFGDKWWFFLLGDEWFRSNIKAPFVLKNLNIAFFLHWQNIFFPNTLLMYERTLYKRYILEGFV